MKIKKQYVESEIGGKTVIVSTGTGEGFNGMITLNGTGKFIWSLIERGLNREDIYAELIGAYEVDPDIAKRDVDTFVDRLLASNIIEE